MLCFHYTEKLNDLQGLIVKKILINLRLWRNVRFFAIRKLRNFLIDKKVTIVTVVSLRYTSIGRLALAHKTHHLNIVCDYF